MTLHVDFDQDLWVYVSVEWPREGVASLEQRSSVGALGDGFGYDASLRAWLQATVAGVLPWRRRVRASLRLSRERPRTALRPDFDALARAIVTAD